MDITVHRTVPWELWAYLRDEPYGDNSVDLKPLQLAFLLNAQHFPEGQTVRLPQPDASYDAVSVTHWDAHGWFFQQPFRELIISAHDWPRVRQQLIECQSPLASLKGA